MGQVSWTDAILNFTMGMPLVSSSTYSIWISRHFYVKIAKRFFCCLPGSNPGPSSCEASMPMLPQNHQVWYKLGGKIQQYNHMWREIQIEYVELEERGIPMVKFLFWMFNLAVPNSKLNVNVWKTYPVFGALSRYHEVDLPECRPLGLIEFLPGR